MAHPHHEHRDHKVQHRRVAHLTKGYAHGGAVHSDEAEDKALIRKEVKRSALKVEGKHAKHRSDKPHRAKGGRTNKKGGKTVVNVIAGGHPAPMGGPAMAGGPPQPMPAAPPMPPRPMMPPPGMPPGGPGMPPGMPPRRAGGRAFAKGGRVADGPAWNEGRRAGTQVQHTPNKSDGKDIGRGKVITYATGGKVEAPQGVAPATKLPGGSGGGEARLAKERRAERDYKRA